MRSIKEKITTGFNKKFLLPAVFMTLYGGLLYDPLDNLKVNSFDRQIGNAVAYGLDVGKRVNNMYFYYLLFLPVLFLLIFRIISWIIKEERLNKEETEFLNKLSAIGFAPLAFSYFNRFENKMPGMDVYLVGVGIFLILVYFVVKSWWKAGEKLRFEQLKWSFCISLPIMMMITAVLSRVNIGFNNQGFAYVYGTVVFLCAMVSVLIERFVKFNILKIAGLPLISMPAFYSLLIEFQNILNQNEIYVDLKVKYLSFGLSLFLTICLMLCLLIYEKSRPLKEFSMERVYYPLLIIGLALIWCQMPLQTEFQAVDLFEEANEGVAAYELFRFGKIPIVENYDPHMFSYMLGQILYGLFNRNFYDALFLSYSLDPFILVLFYFIFKKFFDRDTAFLFILLFPITEDYTYKFFALSGLIILSLINAWKKKKYSSYFLFWALAGVVCLYQLDLGYAFVLAAIVLWGILYWMDRERVDLKKLAVSCLATVSVYGCVCVGLCVMKGVDPVARLKEFLLLAKSNINWAYKDIGNTEQISYVFCYFVVPSVCVALLIWLVYQMRLSLRKKESLKFILPEQFMIAAMLGIAYLFNMSRALVRHSLYEKSLDRVLSMFPLFLIFTVYLLAKKKRLLCSVATGIIMITISGLLLGDAGNPNARSLATNSMEEYIQLKEYNTSKEEKAERIKLEDDLVQMQDSLKNIFDVLLTEEETYLDFTNQTLLYSMVDREKPVYVDQSPGLLSGEETQQMFLEQVEENGNVVFALMPFNDSKAFKCAFALDGIMNSYRYYLISEYISQNYVPFLCNDDFAVWCRRDKLDEKERLLGSYWNQMEKEGKEIGISRIDYLYNEIENHTYDLHLLPSIWASYDKIPANEKQELDVLETDVQLAGKSQYIYGLEPRNFEGTKGSYLYLNGSSSEQGTITVELGNRYSGEFVSCAVFTFDVISGDHREYLLRLSSDFLWYSGYVDSIRIISDVNITVDKLSVLQGDTLK